MEEQSDKYLFESMPGAEGSCDAGGPYDHQPGGDDDL